jgi:hypothetical protein
MNKYRIVIPLVLGVLLAAAVSMAASQTAPLSVNSGQHFLPPYENSRDRFGFDSGPVSDYDVSLLNAGWYSNWGAGVAPSHPDQLAYVQLVRFSAGSDPRDPELVTFSPGKATIAKIAAANPGSLWLLANEPDSVYQGAPIYPEVYAVVYHNLYEYIKGLDPSALIANGGIVQPTPCRLTYLDIVWDTYLDTFGEPMPVDVWNIHAFILREVYNSWGASTPPGVDRNCAMDYTVEQADDMDIFVDNLKDMRAWMKDKGQQNKPLIISEYGVLWPAWYAPQFDAQRVSQFMTRTFDLFLYETDPEIGYPADDYRLVQAWAWYSLSDDRQYNGYLFRSSSKAISAMGQAFADYTAALSDTHKADLSAQLVANWPSFSPTLTESVTFTTSVAGFIGNLGKAPASDVLARFEIVAEGGTTMLGQDAFYDVPARFGDTVLVDPLPATLALPGRHQLRLSLDPEERVDELREWNNVATVTLDLRPDLQPLTLTHHLSGSAPQGRSLELMVNLGNPGGWGAASGSAAVYLEGIDEGNLAISQTLPVPTLAAGGSVSLTTSFPFSPGLYVLRVLADADDAVVESDEDNNLFTTTLDVWPDLLPVGLEQALALRDSTLGLAADLSFTTVVRNQGLWHSQAASATVYLETIPQGTPVLSESLPLPPLSPDASVSLTASLSWPLLGWDLYRLRVVLDEAGTLVEPNVSNNQGVWDLPIPVSASLVPTATTVLTNARGDLSLVFPQGTVDAPAEVVYTPFWPVGQVSETLSPSTIAFDLTSPDGEPLALLQPVTVSWRYGGSSVLVTDVGQLRLFVQGDDDVWQDAACGPYQRPAGQVTVPLCQTGRFVFGVRYDANLPLLWLDSFSGGERDVTFDEVNLPPRLSPH